MHLVSENVDTVKAHFVQHKNLPWSMAVSTKRQQTPSCRHISVSTTLPPQPQLTILHSFLLTNVRQKVFFNVIEYFYSKCCCRYRALNYNYLCSICRKRHYKRYRTAETRITSWTYKRGNVGFHHRHFSGNVDRSRGLRQVHTVYSEIIKPCQLQVCVGDSRKRW